MSKRLTLEQRDEIVNALTALGYHNCKVFISFTAPDHARVTVNSKVIGIYDFAKHTFVD